MFDEKPQDSGSNKSAAFPPPESPKAPTPVDPFSRSVPPPEGPKPKIKTTGKLSSVAWVIIIVVVLGVIGAAGAFGYNYFMNTPDKIFDAAIDNLENLNSGTIDYNLTITAREKAGNALSIFPIGEEFTMKAALQTKFNKQPDDFYQNQTKITLDFPTGTDIPLLGSFTLSPEIDFVMLNKEQFYAKVIGMPFLMLGLEDFNDQWVLVNFEELAKQTGLKMNFDDEADAERKQEVEAVKNTAKRLYKQHRFLTLEKSGTEEMNGLNSYHYTFSLNKPVLKEFIIAMDQDPNLNELLNKYESDPITPEEIDEALAKVDINGELWIAKKEKVFTKVVINLLFNDEYSSGSFAMAINLSDYNQPVTIEEPTDYMTMQELISSVMGGLNIPSDQMIMDNQMMNDTIMEVNDIEQVDFPVPGGNLVVQDYADDPVKTLSNAQIVLNWYKEKTGSYPLPPVHGTDALIFCIGSGGITSTFNNNSRNEGQCRPSDLDALFLPVHNPPDNITYELCSDSMFIMSYPKDGTITYATPNEIGEDLTLLLDGINRETCRDADKDGLSPFLEERYGSQEGNDDTDGDGYLDGEEVENGFNPNGEGELSF